MKENYKDKYQEKKEKLLKIRLIMIDMEAAIKFWTLIYEPQEIMPEYIKKIWELVKDERKEPNEKRW